MIMSYSKKDGKGNVSKNYKEIFFSFYMFFLFTGFIITGKTSYEKISLFLTVSYSSDFVFLFYVLQFSNYINTFKL